MKYFSGFLLSFLLSITAFYWFPRLALMEEVESLTTEVLTNELHHASVEAGQAAYIQALTYITSRYENELQLLHNHSTPWLNQCETKLVLNNGNAVAGLHRTINFLNEPDFDQPNISLYLNCSSNWPIVIGSALLLAISLLIVILRLPRPYSLRRRRWIARLTTDDYEHSNAVTATALLDTASGKKANNEVLEFLYRTTALDFAQVLQLATRFSLDDLSDTQLQWLSKALAFFDTETAVKIARQPEQITFDLKKSQVIIHGWAIELSSTPLFYYAWYALRAIESDGWVKNPQSNKPDKVEGEKLAELMSQWQGHGKAISDLESQGLKSKTLDQNRSKIKEHLSAVLGEELAKPYLFTSKKDEGSDQFSYRLLLSAEQIEIIQP